MANPVMGKNPYFQQGTQVNHFGSKRGGGTQSYTQYTSGTRYGEDYTAQYSPEAYREQMNASRAYTSDASSPHAYDNVYAQSADQQSTMTYRDALNKTGILLAVAVLAGSLTVGLLPLALQMPLAVVATIAAFVVGLVIAFKRMVNPGLAIAYSALEGVALGALTGAFELIFPGIALQAILGTAVIVGVTWALHYSGKVRTSSRGMRFVLIVAAGGIIFGFINMFLVIFGVTDMRTSVTIFGIPLGVFVGIVMILVAAYMLIGDFEMVQYAVNNRAPQVFAWTCAIGIVMTIIWIYAELLRLLAILRNE